MGKEASAYTKSRLAGKFVNLEFEIRKRGSHNRLLAYVILDGKNFNIELVKSGWSRYDTRFGISYRYYAAFIAAEKKAKFQKLNIWSRRK